jgi:hypothetical protein
MRCVFVRGAKLIRGYQQLFRYKLPYVMIEPRVVPFDGVQE